MTREIDTRVVDTGGSAATALVHTGKSEVCWITLSPEAYGTVGSAKIYDGQDAGGRLKWLAEDAQAHTHNFIPAIPCEQGIFVSAGAGIAAFTIAYRPKGWKAEG